MDPSLLFLPLGIVFGLTASYYDIKNKKIPNNLYKPLFISATILHIVLLTLSLLKVIIFPPSLYIEFIVSFIYVSLVAYFLWNLKLISAGDAKMFIALSFLMMPSIFHFNHVFNFYHITFIQNALLISLIYVIPYLFTKTTKKDIKESLKRLLDWKSMLMIVLFVYAFSFLTMQLFKFLGIRSVSIFLNVIILFILLQLFRILFKRKMLYVIIGIAVLRFIIDFNQLTSFSYWYNTIIMSIIIILFRFFFIYLGYNAFSKEVKLEELKPGMILAEKIGLKRTNDKVEFIKTQDYKRTMIELMQENINDELKAFQEEFNYNPREGLKQETIDKLKEWKAKGHLKYDSFFIAENIAFGPFIFLAFILTFLFRGDIITSLFVLLLK